MYIYVYRRERPRVSHDTIHASRSNLLNFPLFFSLREKEFFFLPFLSRFSTRIEFRAKYLHPRKVSVKNISLFFFRRWSTLRESILARKSSIHTYREIISPPLSLSIYITRIKSPTSTTTAYFNKTISESRRDVVLVFTIVNINTVI